MKDLSNTDSSSMVQDKNEESKVKSGRREKVETMMPENL